MNKYIFKKQLDFDSEVCDFFCQEREIVTLLYMLRFCKPVTSELSQNLVSASKWPTRCEIRSEMQCRFNLLHI